MEKKVNTEVNSVTLTILSLSYKISYYENIFCKERLEENKNNN